MSYINTRDVLGDRATFDALVANTLSELREDGADTLASYACVSNKGLTYVEMPGITSKAPGTSAFASCTSLSNASFPNMKSLGNNMFVGCASLENIYAPELEFAGSAAFAGCSALRVVNFPKMTSIVSSMFNGCRLLSSISFSTSLSIVPSTCFSSCGELRSVSFPNVQSVGSNAFYKCVRLSSVSFPSLQTIGSSAFYGCTAMISASFPSVTRVGGYAFVLAGLGKLALPAATTISSNTTRAAEVDFTALKSIPAFAFLADYNLVSVILRNSSVCTMASTNALTRTPIASGIGHIFVPDDLVDAYKSATNWVTYASRIVPLSEYPKEPVTGTITDSWSAILNAEEDGTYTSKYSIGDTKVVDIGGFPMLMQIVAMDADELADGSGNAKITWMTAGVPLSTSMDMRNPHSGGWEACQLRLGLMQSLYDNMDNTVRAAVKTVKKTFSDGASGTTKTVNDNVWIPSVREVFGSSGSGAESSGCVYTGFFTDSTERIKNDGILSTDYPSSWWLRSSVSDYACRAVYTNGTNSSSDNTSTCGVVFGFCT